MDPDAVTIQSCSYTGLDKAAAAAWEVKYSKPKGAYFYQLKPFADDCQDFISQGMRAGGWKESTADDAGGTLGVWYSILTPGQFLNSVGGR